MSTQETARLPDRAPAPEEIVGLLTDPLRRRLMSLLVDGPRDLAALVDAGGAPRDVIEQLGRLEAARVVKSDGKQYELVGDVFARSIRDAVGQRIGRLNDEHTQLARRYFFRNRLLQVPSDEWALKVVLDLIAEDFQPGDVYDEREVNTTLYGWHGDWALLRRLLVDRGYLSRDHGRYWRVVAARTPRPA